MGLMKDTKGEEKAHTVTPLTFHAHDQKKLIKSLGKERLINALEKMVLIRQFETRAEASYLQGKIGGFFHSYIGQEAIQTGAVEALGKNNWFITSYRCHALTLLQGETPESLMAELFGKATGNAKGRGGSMHLYSDRMLGGYGIVGGQIPIATGAALSSKYLGKKDEVAICFFGDGAVPQGAFHESLNMASIMSLPCIYVIENNHWSMGTPLTRTLANFQNFSKHAAEAYGMQHYRLDGMNFFNTYNGFSDAYRHVVEKGRPVLIECVTHRFKGHSISDPGLYRTRDELKSCMERDPIIFLKNALIDANLLTEDEFKEREKNIREKIIEAVQYADESPWPDPAVLGEDVFAP